MDMSSDFNDSEKFYDNDYIKSSRAKKTYEARKKIEDYLERKRFKKSHDEVKDIDWDLEFD